MQEIDAGCRVALKEAHTVRGVVQVKHRNGKLGIKWYNGSSSVQTPDQVDVLLQRGIGGQEFEITMNGGAVFPLNINELPAFCHDFHPDGIEPVRNMFSDSTLDHMINVLRACRGVIEVKDHGIKEDSYPADDKKAVGKILVPVVVIRKDIDDLITGALEGGIIYWCSKATVKDGDYRGCDYASETVSRGATLVLTDNEEEEEGKPKTYELTLEKCLAAIPKVLEWAEQDWRTFVENHDAAGADVFVQCALFGEIVYS